MLLVSPRRGYDPERKCSGEPGISDELNLHVPQTPEGQFEVKYISSVKSHLMSSQASKTLIAIVQDSLLAVYMMTQPHVKVSRRDFYNILLHGDCEATHETWTCEYINHKIKYIKDTYTFYGKENEPGVKDETFFSGRFLFSMMLPDNLFYSKTTGVLKEEPTFKIERGVLLEGVANKAIFGTGHNCLTQVLHKDYGPSTAIEMVNNVQFICNAWLTTHSFTIGIKDCFTTSEQEEKIDNIIMRCFMDAHAILDTNYHERIKENKINFILGQARDKVNKLAKDNLEKGNHFISTVEAGSKGDYVNITQITGCLGQQNLTGKRMMPQLNKRRRMMSHYPLMYEAKTKFKSQIPIQKCDTAKDMIKFYESRGFVKNSFIVGLNPMELFFHSVGGREGITNTACKTAESGYLQRKMV